MTKLNWRDVVPPPQYVRDKVQDFYTTDDNKELILYADRHNRRKRYFKDFAESLRGRNDLETAKNVFSFVKSNVKYVRDRVGEDTVKSANTVLYDGEADCKGLTLLVNALLKELRIQHKTRFASYDNSQRIQHVYTIVKIDGCFVPMDVVFGRFGGEAICTYFEDWTENGQMSINGTSEDMDGNGLLIVKGLLLLLLGRAIFKR